MPNHFKQNKSIVLFHYLPIVAILNTLSIIPCLLSRPGPEMPRSKQDFPTGAERRPAPGPESETSSAPPAPDAGHGASRLSGAGPLGLQGEGGIIGTIAE